MKATRWIGLLLALLLALPLTAFGSDRSPYEEGMALLNAGQYAEAAEKFDEAGTQDDAPQLAIYAKAHVEAEKGNFTLAARALRSLGDFMDASMQATYYTARRYEANADYDSAMETYEEILPFRDSAARIASIQAHLYSRIAYACADHEGNRYVVVYGLNNRYGMIDDMGTLIVPCEWKESFGFSEGLANVREGGLFGFFDTTGALVIPYEWDYAYNFSGGFAYVRKGGAEDGLFGFIDTTGALVVPCEWENAYSFSEGLAAVKKDGLWGYIDATGTLVIPCEWEDTYGFSEGLAYVRKDGLWGFIDTTGALVIPCEWEEAGSFSGGLAPVRRDDLWGFIDMTDTLVIPCEWNHARSFHDGLACVRQGSILNGLYGFIDTAGMLVIPCEYELVTNFDDGYAQIYTHGHLGPTGFIDTTGAVVIPCEYDSGAYAGGRFFLIEDDYLTIMDAESNILF